MHPLLGAALMAALAQFATGAEAPFVTPDSLLPGYGVEYCDPLLSALLGGCTNLCAVLAELLGLPLLCPA